MEESLHKKVPTELRDTVAANRYWLLECVDLLTAGNFHTVPGHNRKASAAVAVAVPAGLAYTRHTADLVPVGN